MLRHIRHKDDLGVNTINQLIDEINAARNIKVSGGMFSQRSKNGTVLSGGGVTSVVGGGGVSQIWGEVIEAITYPDPENENDGIEQYTVRLLTTTYPVWDVDKDYDEGEAVTDPDDGRLYESIYDGENIGNQPKDSPWYWELQDEIEPRPIGQEADYESLIEDPPDMRLFVPWFQIDDIVPLIRRSVTVGQTTETLYFFAVHMIRVRKEDEHAQSIFWDDQDNRMIAGFG